MMVRASHPHLFQTVICTTLNLICERCTTLIHLRVILFLAPEVAEGDENTERLRIATLTHVPPR